MTTQHNGLSDVKLRYLDSSVRPSKILDLGAGNCQYSVWVRQRFPEAEIVAVDHIRPLSMDTIVFHVVDIEKELPFEDGSFETIIAFDILEHIQNIDGLIKELRRILKPGGIIVGSVPHDDDKFLPAYNLTFYHRSDVTHKRYYTEKSIKNLFETYDFNTIETSLEGGVSPAVIAEFFPSVLRPCIKKIIGLLRRIGLIQTDILKSDLFFKVYKK